MLYAPNTLYSEFFKGLIQFPNCWIVFRSKRVDTAIHELVKKSGYCIFRDESHLIADAIEETKQISSTDPSLQWIAEGAFLRILALLYQSESTKNPNCRKIRPLVRSQSTPHSFSEKIYRFLKENISSDVSVKTAAHHLGISRSSFSHRFSIEIGETLVELKNRLRIEQSQQLMATSPKQLKEIAYEVGFKNPSYFTHLFRKMTGVSPTDYRMLLARNKHGGFVAPR